MQFPTADTQTKHRLKCHSSQTTTVFCLSVQFYDC